MKLNKLVKYKKANKRLGRGRATGVGKTAGRGHKGQKARAGKKLRSGFEGGQTPLFKRLPKYRGFSNPNTVEFQVINVGDLEQLSSKEVNRSTLLDAGIIRKKEMPIKILGNGDLSKAITIHAEKASQSAIEKINKAGGKFVSTMVQEMTKEDKEAKDTESATKEESQ